MPSERILSERICFRTGLTVLLLTVASEEVSDSIGKRLLADVISGPNVAWSEHFSIALIISW